MVSRAYAYLPDGTRLAIERRVDIARIRPKTRVPRALLPAIVGAAAIAGVTIAASRLNTAAPSIDRATLAIGTVVRGDFVRQVQAQGTLVPEEVRWLSAVTAGRVERLPIKPGAHVEADTVVVELSNPEVQLAELDADQKLASAQADLVKLGVTLENQSLTQASTVASEREDLAAVERRAGTFEALQREGLASELDHTDAVAKQRALHATLGFDEKRLGVLTAGQRDQLTAQRTQIAKLEKLLEFRREQTRALRVTAGIAGTVQDVPLEPGQWVLAGALLAKVARPDRLKAQLRVPETLAKDVALGQDVAIDTRNGVAHGTVARVDPGVNAGTVKVDVALAGELPKGARPDLTVDGLVTIETLHDVLSIPRPAQAQPGAPGSLFRLEAGGAEAARVPVRFGKASAKSIEVESGLTEGDKVVLSDTSTWDGESRLRVR